MSIQVFTDLRCWDKHEPASYLSWYQVLLLSPLMHHCSTQTWTLVPFMIECSIFHFNSAAKLPLRFNASITIIIRKIGWNKYPVSVHVFQRPTCRKFPVTHPKGYILSGGSNATMTHADVSEERMILSGFFPVVWLCFFLSFLLASSVSLSTEKL